MPPYCSYEPSRKAHCTGSVLYCAYFLSVTKQSGLAIAERKGYRLEQVLAEGLELAVYIPPRQYQTFAERLTACKAIDYRCLNTHVWVLCNGEDKIVGF